MSAAAALAVDRPTDMHAAIVSAALRELDRHVPPWLLLCAGPHQPQSVRGAAPGRERVIVDMIAVSDVLPKERADVVDLEIQIPGPGHESLSARVSDEAIGVLITTLTLVRERARIQGILRPAS